MCGCSSSWFIVCVCSGSCACRVVAVVRVATWWSATAAVEAARPDVAAAAATAAAQRKPTCLSETEWRPQYMKPRFCVVEAE